MLSIRTNLSSFIAKNSLQTSTNKLNQAIERMTTGAKINHAKDNAANYSIKTNLSTKICAYDVAADNVAMGLELIGTAEGSLNLISEHLQRLRDLAVQSGNGTYGAQSQEAINAEANTRIAEIERLYNTAEYNGIKLLKTNVSAKNFDGMERVSEAASIEANKSYRIDDYTDLKALQDFVNGGGNTTNVTFELTSDIDLNGKAFRGIGTSDAIAFKGTFNGNGHVIKNLVITTSQQYAGLFGHIIGATIDSVGLEKYNTSGGYAQGGLIGKASYSNITNCYVTGKSGVGSGHYVGGLVGYLSNGTIKNCYSSTDVIMDGAAYTGGLVGWATGTITNCYATGTVRGGHYSGGLVAYSSGAFMINNYATGAVSGSQATGGLVGVTQNGSNIVNSYAVGTVSGQNLYGAFVGEQMGGSVSNSYCNQNACAYVVGQGGSTAGIEAKTVAEIEAICTPEAMGFTEANGWTVVNGTPRLAWEFPNGGDVSISLQVGVGSSENSSIRFNVSIDLSGLSNIMDAGLSDSSSLQLIDNLLALTSAKAVEYGAVLNRLESVLDEIAIQYDNLVSSRSTIRDADIAKVSSQYIQQQILQQASATLLSSAQNVQAQNMLGLLQSLR